RGAAEGLGYFRDRRAVEPLQAVLASKDPGLQRSAAAALMMLGDKKGAATLLPLLDERSPNVRRAAATAIGRLNGPAHAAELVAHVNDRDRGVRRALLDSLVAIQDNSAEVVDALLSLSRDQAVDLRYAAVKALGRAIGEERVVDRLLDALADPVDQVRRAAVHLLAAHKVARAVPRLCDLLRDGPERLSQIKAAQALGALGDQQAVERLSFALLVEDFSLQDAAAQALTSILGEVDLDSFRAQANASLERWSRVTEMGSAAIPPLVRTVQNQDRTAHGTRIRSAAARALGVLARLGHAAALSPLLDLLDERTPAVRVAAADALVTAGEPAAAAKIALLLDDQNPELRAAAVKALGALGQAGSAQRLFELALGDPEREVRLAAVEAQGHLGVAALPALKRLLASDQEQECRLLACGSLGRLGTILAVDLLIGALGDADSRVRFTAGQMLKRYGWSPVGLRTRRVDAGFARWTLRSEWTDSPEPVPQQTVLIQGLQDADPARRRAAAEALGDLKDGQAIEPLRRLLDDPDVDVAIVAAQALVALGVEPEDGDRWIPYRVVQDDEARVLAAGSKVLPALRSELRHPEAEVRARVVQMLAGIGTVETIPLVLSSLADRYPEVVQAGLLALSRLGADAVRAAYRRQRKKEEKEASLQELLPLAADPAGEVRGWAFVALCAIDHPDVLPVLT
ncbi:MAG: hypothetical protein FJ125_13050, partial [Deltaproteobacteria bacterium]|nr:hypothetical protein [Deltaproteobacteria bacterium]